MAAVNHCSSLQNDQARWLLPTPSRVFSSTFPRFSLNGHMARSFCFFLMRTFTTSDRTESCDLFSQTKHLTTALILLEREESVMKRAALQQRLIPPSSQLAALELFLLASTGSLLTSSSTAATYCLEAPSLRGLRVLWHYHFLGLLYIFRDIILVIVQTNCCGP